MDVSIYESDDIRDILAIMDVDGRRRNRDPNLVLGFLSMGSRDSRQIELVTKAIHIVARQYAQIGITVTFEKVHNDQVKYKFQWTVTQYIDVILGADIHLIPTHLHQAMVWQAGDSWTIPNITKELDRLYHHLGVPMGKYVHCPVWRQDKWKIYQFMGEFMAPTIHINLTHEEVSIADLARIERFVDEINANPRFKNDNKFCVKLNYTTGSKNNSTVKSCFGGIHGKYGILKRIGEFRRNRKIVGYFDSILIQPLLKHNTENKSVCFNGECYGANPRKQGSQGRSFSPPVAFHDSFDDYAQRMVRKFREACPSLIADQLLRIDYYCEDPDDFNDVIPAYLLNEVEGYEAQTLCPELDKVRGRILNHWVQDINACVKCHLRRINHPLSEFILKNKEFEFVIFKTSEYI